MSTLLGGSYINNFNRFGKLYQTYIQAAPEYRRDKYSLESYFVDDGQGNSIPVSSFTTVRDTTGVEFVSQFNLYRSIRTYGHPRGPHLETTVMQDITRTAAQVLPDASARHGAAPPFRKPTLRRPEDWSTCWRWSSCSSRWRPCTNRGGCRWRF